MRPVRLVALGMTLLAVGCASAGGGGGGEEASGDQDRYLITAAELTPFGSALSAHEAIRRLRRFWLQGSGGRSVRVQVNNRDTGGEGSLQDYNAAEVVEMRFITANAAMTQFGPDYAGGLIKVTIR